ncbi:MAG: response regulator transcription factor [Burkholderiaceae bacterium]|nr:response regulator transcription factor [Burkholderiaceae bacterium]
MPITPLIRIVDDDKALAESFRLLLETIGWDTTIYTDGQTFLDKDDPTRPGCIVLDVRMPGMTGLEVQEKLLERGSRLPILFLSAHGSIPMAVSSVQKGAVDFLEKPIEPATLLAKLTVAVAKSMTETIEHQEKAKLLARFDSLTPRERTIVTEMLTGNNANKLIARKLNLEISTVKMHRANAFMKLDVHSLAELTRLAQEAGFYA